VPARRKRDGAVAMNDEELEEIKRRKLEALLRAQAEQENAEAQKRAYEEQKAAILRQILTPEARERLTRLKLARPEFASAVEDQLILLAQSGQIRRMIDDETLKTILARLTEQRREIRIKRV